MAVALLLGSALALHFAAGSSAEGPTIEASGPGSSGYFWKPSAATVAPGGAVSFKNPSTSVPHGVKWTGGPEKPSCSGVPVEAEEISWSGSCTFAQAGTYAFVCTVHPTEMKGTITVTSAEVPPGPPPPSKELSESPLQGSASRALRLAKSQRGDKARGSVNLSMASTGGKLEVALLASRASLSGSGSSATSTVGRFVRSSLKAGRLDFAVPLKRVALRALRSKKKLSLVVQVVVTPPGGTALTLKRGVVLHD